MSKGGKGYTILEVLIFIAVSSLMFVTAIVAIGGRQQQVQFSQGAREFDAKIQDIINDVTTGYFPTNETISCSIINGEVQVQSSSDQKLGTNDDCIYIGKAVQFQPNGESSKIIIYSLAGKRFVDATSLTPSLSIADASPKAVALPLDSNFRGSEENYLIPNGLMVKKVFQEFSSSDIRSYGVIAIMSNFGGSRVSEGQTVQVGGIFGTSMGSDESTAVDTINKLSDNPDLDGQSGYMDKNPAGGLIICFESPEGRKASIKMGLNGSNSTELKLDNYEAGCDL